MPIKGRDPSVMEETSGAPSKRCNCKATDGWATTALHPGAGVGPPVRGQHWSTGETMETRHPMKLRQISVTLKDQLSQKTARRQDSR